MLLDDAHRKKGNASIRGYRHQKVVSCEGSLPLTALTAHLAVQVSKQLTIARRWLYYVWIVGLLNCA